MSLTNSGLQTCQGYENYINQTRQALCSSSQPLSVDQLLLFTQQLQTRVTYYNKIRQIRKRLHQGMKRQEQGERSWDITLKITSGAETR